HARRRNIQAAQEDELSGLREHGIRNQRRQPASRHAALHGIPAGRSRRNGRIISRLYFCNTTNSKAPACAVWLGGAALSSIRDASMPSRSSAFFTAFAREAAAVLPLVSCKLTLAFG